MTGPPLARRLRVTWASTITPLAVVWAWLLNGVGRIAAGTMVLAAGREGTGKSSFGLWITARITTGTLPGSFFGTPRRVLYVAVEDSWAHTLVPRLVAAGADLSMIGRVDVTSTGDDQLSLSLPDDLAALERTIVENKVAMVVLDPLLSMIGERIDTHRNREVREALDPLAQLADRTGIVLLGIAHFNKSAGTDAAALISGSGAFKDVPRAIFGFARDDEGRVMTQVKNSLGRDDQPSLSYEITSASVPVKGGVAEVGTFTFTGESTRSVTDVLRGTDERGEERTDTENWLRRLLSDGPMKATEVYQAADAAGLSKDKAKRAKANIKALAAKQGMSGGWYWALPEHAGDLEESTKGVKSAEEKDLHPSHPSVRPSVIEVDFEAKGRGLRQQYLPELAECGHPLRELTTDLKCPACIVQKITQGGT